MKQYANYHKHDHVSNIYTPDTHVKCEAYLKRIKELGYDYYWTTNHGSGGDIFEAKTLCKQYGIHCMFGVEGYIVPNPLEQDKRNYHIIIVPKTNAARKKVNLITSRANIEGYYYKPRFFFDDLLALDKDDIYITSACVAGIIRDEDGINQLFIPLFEHFRDNIFLELQNHLHNSQLEINKKCIDLSQKYGIQLIAANDSHYIYPEDAKDRLEFLKGKGINYGDEDVFVLDYPDYDTMFARFKKQGILSDQQIEQAINNTRIFETCEEIDLNTEIKMPTAYPSLNTDEKIRELKNHINAKFRQIAKDENIVGDKYKTYVKGIREEMKVIEDTKEINTADYFLLNEKIVDLAVNKYGGVLTRTGRGSCGAFYLNRVLGMTQIDRFTSPIKLYPERFMSTARLLENKAAPDIDYNVKDQEPFIKAAREVLGEQSVYPMVAYGTMQLGEAFRNVCRSRGFVYDDFNDVAKNIESYMDNEKWKPVIEEAQKYVDVIVSASVHPCAHLMDNKDLRSEYGVVKIGKALCVMITSGEADAYRCLKDDFLVVSVWGIIADTFKLIGKPIIAVKQLIDSLDDRVWKLYEDGITCTLNQVDSDYATSLMRKYKVKSLRELSQFSAAVRPSFDSWRDGFINRQPYTTGSSQLDEVLSETEGRITFQETLMRYFEWLGVTPAESIGLIKKISKKKIHPEDFQKLEEKLKSNWIINTGSENNFAATWQMVQSCMAYGFAAPHALATAIDSLYSAWLKVHYPLQYYTIVFGYYEGDEERTKKLTKEIDYFGIKLKGIKFRHSSDKYTMDEENNSIYKSLSSVKFVSPKTATMLYEMRNDKFDNFINLLKIFPGNSRELSVLIRLNYFEEFGKTKKLLLVAELYDKYHGKKVLKKDKVDLPIDIIQKYAITETEKQYRFDDNSMDALIAELYKLVPDEDIPLQTRLQAQQEFLGYIDYVDPSAINKAVIMDIDVKYSPKLTIWKLDLGYQTIVKMYKKSYQQNPLCVGDIITYRTEQKPKSKMVDGKWEKCWDTMEDWIVAYNKVYDL